ncbi:hypothetical protein OAN307_c12630 [Octadecabacter antarcticus 307]|uniref:Uncharacterized protein n=1 Tax=Octadecabacter antarcticus 307 TaxID=391626 RepID=M9R433_9RHOB|nr:hypothetical protein OAN307_c12630 [Octadecabacter antarcticus 307]
MDGLAENQLFLSAAGYLTEVQLTQGAGVGYFTSYVSGEGMGKFSANDDLYLLVLDQTGTRLSFLTPLVVIIALKCYCPTFSPILAGSFCALTWQPQTWPRNTSVKARKRTGSGAKCCSLPPHRRNCFGVFCSQPVGRRRGAGLAICCLRRDCALRAPA